MKFFYFNTEDIEHIIFEGYIDSHERKYQEACMEELKEITLEKLKTADL